jgi:hypothetical protein
MNNKQSIWNEIRQQWSVISGLFVVHKFDGPKQLTPDQAADLLWRKFVGKVGRRKNKAVLSARLEILHPMPYTATVYRKKGGKWLEYDVEGETPLTCHVIGEIDVGGGRALKVFHRFIGKTFPQYVGA